MTKGERIKARREALNFSQTYVAEKIQVKKQTLYKYENNIISNIPSDKIESLARVLDTTASYLMGWTNDIENKPIQEIKATSRMARIALESDPNSNASKAMINYELERTISASPEILELISYYKALKDEDKKTLFLCAANLNKDNKPIICNDKIEKELIKSFRIASKDIRYAVCVVLGIKGDLESEAGKSINE